MMKTFPTNCHISPLSIIRISCLGTTWWYEIFASKLFEDITKDIDITTVYLQLKHFL